MKGASTSSRWRAATTAVVPSWVTLTPSLPKARAIRSKCCGTECRTRTSPPVIAPNARNVTTSWWSVLMVSWAPPSWSTPSTVSWLVPIPSIRAPIATRAWQRSCTWGSLAALIRVEVPSARAAAIRKFSVAVTDM